VRRPTGRCGAAELRTERRSEKKANLDRHQGDGARVSSIQFRRLTTASPIVANPGTDRILDALEKLPTRVLS
jgi:hypothetical protein